MRTSLAGNPPRSPGAGQGRPRSQAVDQAVFQAVRTLLGNGVPLAELSMEGIARAAGVGKAAIYRRWGNKEELLIDVLRATEPAKPELPGTSMREDLVILLESSRQLGRIWDAYRTAVITPRRDLVLHVLRRGQANGELRADVDLELAVDMVIGPLVIRSLLYPTAALPEGHGERIVDTLLQGLR